MNNYTEEAKQIYNKVCDKYKHHWLDTTVSQTMAMEMITEALTIPNVVGQSEQLSQCKCGNAVHVECDDCKDDRIRKCKEMC